MPSLSIDASEDALGLIAVQGAFMPGGSLPMHDGDAVVAPINRLLRLPFSVRFAAQDWHPPGHLSFASSHPGYAPMQVVQLDYGPMMLWPDHALQGTREADLHEKLDAQLLDLIIRGGVRRDEDGLSAFSDRGGRFHTGLAPLLMDRGISRIFLAGLALDISVAATAEDAARCGFATFVIEDACRPSKPDVVAETRPRLARANVTLIRMQDLE